MFLKNKYQIIYNESQGDHRQVVVFRQVFFAGHIPQVTITGHSIFARKQHKNNLNSANRTRLALKYIFSKHFSQRSFLDFN